MKTRPSHLSATVVLMATSLLAGNVMAGEDRLVVHEWGTFTCLRDDNGEQLPGINVDDEPLPAFVHNLAAGVVRPDLLATRPRPGRGKSKAIPSGHGDVTLRLETPVIYFYPPAGRTSPLELDVHVDFHGGWLTEFYPQAIVTAPGLNPQAVDFGSLDPGITGSLDWRKLKVGTAEPGPITEAPVWNLPRQVQAATVTAASGESEKYLFYRGVGNLSSPLRVEQSSRDKTVSCRTMFYDLGPEDFPFKLGPLWLVHVRPDGQTAFRELPPIDVADQKTDARFHTPREFPASEYSEAATDRLSASMHAALVRAGLFEDEATAMLATWRHAYLTSPGFRLFFLVPRAWTDRRLPLTISEPARIERVMMARTELVSREQRELLAALREMSGFDTAWMEQACQAPGYARLAAGRSDFGDLGVTIPADFQAYLDLGRFRSVLLIRESQQRPSKNIEAFFDAYQLRSQSNLPPSR